MLCVLVLITAGFYSTVGEFSTVTHEQKNVYLLQFRSIVAYRNTDTFPCHHRSLSLSPYACACVCVYIYLSQATAVLLLDTL